MTDAEMQAILERCEKATPGPWQSAPWNTRPNGYLYGPAPPHKNAPPPGLMKCHPPVSFRGEDADFIAHARTDVPALLAEVEQLRTLVAKLRQTVRKHGDDCDFCDYSGADGHAPDCPLDITSE